MCPRMVRIEEVCKHSYIFSNPSIQPGHECFVITGMVNSNCYYGPYSLLLIFCMTGGEGKLLLAYSTHLIEDIRLVPGNVVMVATYMCGKSPSQRVDIWGHVKTYIFNYFG